MHSPTTLLILAAAAPLFLPAQTLPAAAPPPARGAIQPQIAQVVEAVSEERVAAIMKKLESFGTRHTLSSTDHPERGIGAARRWIFDEFKRYSPRLDVRFDSHQVSKSGRITRDVEVVNVVAVLKGTTSPGRHILVTGHYDSLGNLRNLESAAEIDAVPAPGVADNASGTAAVMELARVMSRHEWDKTIVFIAFAAEEQGLIGASRYVKRAQEAGDQIEAVLNADIIGSDVAGNGARANRTVRLFSGDPADSPSRALARYAKETAERYVPSMRVDLVFRDDRFGRGGDHTPFHRAGFAAVRWTTPAEHYANQHSATDTFENASPAYAARVTRMKGAVAASLALAPRPPLVMREANPAPEANQATRRGPAPMLERGASRYDAVLKWTHPTPEPDLAGYVVTVRATTAPLWEREIWVGKVNEYTLPEVSIDDVVFGVKAVDTSGNESLVSSYLQPPRVIN